MAVVRLPDGIKFEVDESLDEFLPKWTEALAEGILIEMKSPKGKRRMLNPFQIIYASDDDEVPA